MTPEETTGAPEQTPEGTATPWVLDAITRASDVIIVTDQRDRIAYVNDAIRDLTGTEPADLAGEAVLALVAPKDHSRVLDVLRMARFGDEPDTQILELNLRSASSLRAEQLFRWRQNQKFSWRSSYVTG